jgi:hypothetical protein
MLRSRLLLFATATVLLLPLPQLVNSLSVVVHNGYEFHAALTSSNVTWILLGNNVSGWPAILLLTVTTTAPSSSLLIKLSKNRARMPPATAQPTCWLLFVAAGATSQAMDNHSPAACSSVLTLVTVGTLL